MGIHYQNIILQPYDNLQPLCANKTMFHNRTKLSYTLQEHVGIFWKQTTLYHLHGHHTVPTLLPLNIYGMKLTGEIDIVKTFQTAQMSWCKKW